MHSHMHLFMHSMGISLCGVFPESPWIPVIICPYQMDQTQGVIARPFVTLASHFRHTSCRGCNTHSLARAPSAFIDIHDEPRKAAAWLQG